MTAEAVADAGLERVDQDVVRAPAIPVGIAEEHRQFPGTMWVSEDTFRNYVGEAVESLAHHGFDRIVIVNGHGRQRRRPPGGRWPTHQERRRLRRSLHLVRGRRRAHRRHGPRRPLETGLLRHLEPDRIREERIDEARAGAADGWGDWTSYVNLAYDAAEFTENGVVGDPDDGDAQRGEALLELAADALARLLEAVDERDVSRPERR